MSSFRVPFFGGGEFFFLGSLGCLFGLNLRDFGSPLPFFPSSHGRTGFPRRPQLRSHPRHQNQEEEEGAVPYGGQGEEVATGVPSPATGVPPPRDTPPPNTLFFFPPPQLQPSPFEGKPAPETSSTKPSSPEPSVASEPMEQDRPGTPVPAVEVPEPMETCKLGGLSVEKEEEEGETVGGRGGFG